MTEAFAVNKPFRRQARPLGDFVKPCLGETFARQGFASGELITRWADIVGPEIATHAEPLKMQWPRNQQDNNEAEPATLVLRVEGPTAIEIQHMSAVVLERVNRFFGWQAVGRLALRQAPLARRAKPPPPAPDAQAAARIAAQLPDIEDDALRGALGRLGAAIKQT
jgi:hypothetical protein